MLSAFVSYHWTIAKWYEDYVKGWNDVEKICTCWTYFPGIYVLLLESWILLFFSSLSLLLKYPKTRSDPAVEGEKLNDRKIRILSSTLGTPSMFFLVSKNEYVCMYIYFFFVLKIVEPFFFFCYSSYGSKFEKQRVKTVLLNVRLYENELIAVVRPVTRATIIVDGKTRTPRCADNKSKRKI